MTVEANKAGWQEARWVAVEAELAALILEAKLAGSIDRGGKMGRRGGHVASQSVPKIAQTFRRFADHACSAAPRQAPLQGCALLHMPNV